MTIADYIFAACMTVVIVWIVSESERRGPFGRNKQIKNSRGSIFVPRRFTAMDALACSPSPRQIRDVRRNPPAPHGV
jgi:hypothetical protein